MKEFKQLVAFLTTLIKKDAKLVALAGFSILAGGFGLLYVNGKEMPDEAA